MPSTPPRALLLLSLLLAACEGEDKPSDDDSGAGDGAADGAADGTADGGGDGGEPELPTIAGATLSPEAAIVGDTLTCTPGATADPLGEAVEVLFAWEVDGELIDDADDTFGAPARGSSVRCGAIPRAGARVGETAWAGPLVISNAPPTADGAEITPGAPTTADVLLCAPIAPRDADGDPSSDPECMWDVSGVRLDEPSCALPAGLARRGDGVVCTLTLNDGIDLSEALVSAPVTIGNAAPVIREHDLSPDPAGAGDTLTASWVAADPDSDGLSVQHSWELNGLPLRNTDARLAPGDFARGDTVTHTLTVDDGELSAWSSFSLTIGNTAPEAPEAELSPLPAREGGRDLVCALLTESFDLDGDLVTYTVGWTVDGVPVTSGLWSTELPNDTVPGALLVEGEVWACTMSPDDGLSVGAPATLEATVGPYLPDLLVDGGVASLAAGIYDFAEVRVINGGTLEINGLVEIAADLFTLDAASSIDGRGRGEPSSAGPGAGSGAVDANAGAGGGGHGGVGGRGGYDLGDTVNAGGAEVGDASSEAITAGSGGGLTVNGPGGAGGAGLGLWAAQISLAGTVDLRGTAGVDGGQCTGGGAGGGLLLVGDAVWVSGPVWASGGDGGQGTSTANDSGGGGGGGRFKLFYDAAYDLSGTVDVSGGAGGPYGTGELGEDGAAGTTHVELLPWP